MSDDGRLDSEELQKLLSATAAPAPAAGSAGPGPLAADEPGSFGALVRRAPAAGAAPSASIALVLAILLGGIGAHWLYLRRWGLAAGRLAVSVLAGGLYAAGTAYAVAHGDALGYGSSGDHTAGFLHLLGGLLWVAAAVWWVVDVVGIARRSVTDADGRYVA